MNPKKVRQAKTAAGVLVRSIPHKNVLTPPPTSKSNYTLLRRIMEVESHLCLEENDGTWASGGHLPPSSTSMTQTLLENGNIPILGWLEGSMQAMTWMIPGQYRLLRRDGSLDLRYLRNVPGIGSHRSLKGPPGHIGSFCWLLFLEGGRIFTRMFTALKGAFC